MFLADAMQSPGGEREPGLFAGRAEEVLGDASVNLRLYLLRVSHSLSTQR